MAGLLEGKVAVVTGAGGGVVVVIAIVMIVTIVLVEHVRGLSALFDVLILGVALAVAAVPEGLPAALAHLCGSWRAQTLPRG